MAQPHFGKGDKCILHGALDLNDLNEDIKIDVFAYVDIRMKM